MSSGNYSIAVRHTAERIGLEWLRTHGYCDCAIQQQTIAVRLLPVVAMFEREIRLGTYAALTDMTWRLAEYITRSDDALRKGLHRPGASAAGPDLGHGQSGNGQVK